MKSGPEQWCECRVAAYAAVKHSGYELIRQIGVHQLARYGTPLLRVLKPLKTLLDCECTGPYSDIAQKRKKDAGRAFRSIRPIFDTKSGDAEKRRARSGSRGLLDMTTEARAGR
jgi:hypothetical protein